MLLPSTAGSQNEAHNAFGRFYISCHEPANLKAGISLPIIIYIFVAVLSLLDPWVELHWILSNSP